MKPVLIGKGMYRISVRSKAKRERLAKFPEVQTDGIRVIFPEWLMPHVERILKPSARSKTKQPDQTTLFDE